MAGTNVNKPQVLQHSKTIHRPLISYICMTGVSSTKVEAVASLENTALNLMLNSAGRNGIAVPFQPSSDIDTEGLIVAAGENRVLVYESGSQNVLNDPTTGEEIYGRLVVSETGYSINYFILNDQGQEVAIDMNPGTYDYFMPYRFSFEKLPDDALIRVKSKRVNDDAAGSGGREVMEIIEIPTQNTPNPLSFLPIPGTFVWGHVDGHTVDSLPNGGFSVTQKDIAWNNTGSYDLETSDRFVVHYETYDLAATPTPTSASAASATN